MGWQETEQETKLSKLEGKRNATKKIMILSSTTQENKKLYILMEEIRNQLQLIEIISWTQVWIKNGKQNLTESIRDTTK